MVSEDVVQSLDRHVERHVVTEAQVDDALVRLALTENELAEVAIVGDQDAPLGVSETQHLGVRQARRVLATDPDRIVATTLEVGDQTRVAALIQQESQERAAGALAASWCRGRRPVSLAWA